MDEQRVREIVREELARDKEEEAAADTTAVLETNVANLEALIERTKHVIPNHRANPTLEAALKQAHCSVQSLRKQLSKQLDQQECAETSYQVNS